MPLVLVLHGSERDGGYWRNNSGWSEKADAAGFVVAYPENAQSAQAQMPPNPAGAAPNKSGPSTAKPQAPTKSPAPAVDGQGIWQAAPPQAGAGGKGGENDDLKFIVALLDDIQQRYPIDPRRVYVSGFGEGAAMTYRIGADLSKRVAAIAPVAGSLLLPELAMARPVSLLAVAGSEDPLYPLNGGDVTLGSGRVVTRSPLGSVVDRWARTLECPTAAAIVFDQDGVLGRAYRPCKADSEVVWYVVSGLGHVWTDGKLAIGQRKPPLAYPIKATDMIWEFFSRHQLP
jgi:polyhydroxybutyrate depolymerase